MNMIVRQGNEKPKETVAEIIARIALAKANKQTVTFTGAPLIICDDIIDKELDNEKTNDSNNLLLATNSTGNELLVAKSEVLEVVATPSITLNDKQLAFADLATKRKSCILVGAAGTGKTTAVKHTVTRLLSDPTIPVILHNTGSQANPRLRRNIKGIVGCAFTNRAVGNLTANFPTEMQEHCMTIHALLEFQPVEDMRLDSTTGELVKKMLFEPNRNSTNPLPSELKVIIIEESSMVGTDLWTMLTDAIHHEVQFIFLGDLNQLSPVFGDAILGYKLLELPVVELTEVYRQALESPIIRLAHKILSGKQMFYKDFSMEHNGLDSTWQVPSKLTIACWQENQTAEISELVALKYLEKCYKAGTYCPETDMVILPFNKQFGCINIGKGIAQFLDEIRNIHPVEIFSGFQKVYFAEGDLVIYKNEEFVITKIYRNQKYRGFTSDDDIIYNRFGSMIGRKSVGSTISQELHENILDQLMEASDKDTQDEASHKMELTPVRVTVRNRGAVTILTSRGQINVVTLAYATTCHKAQGLEAKKVFILVHKSHATLLSREWLYTAVTRAKESLVIMCERNTFIKGINNQQIKGDTLAKKAEYFKGKKISQNTSY